MSDTPRTDEQINGKPCTQFGILAGDCLRNAAVPSEFARTLERELNAANDRIKNLESALCTVQNIDKVNAYQDLESANERIKRLEEALDKTTKIAARHIQQLENGGDEAIYKTNLFDRESHWTKAKEAKL